jgi:hypothetical protein
MMKKATVLLSLAAACFAGTAFAMDDEDGNGHEREIKRVLLISIDDMHTIDFRIVPTESTRPTTTSLITQRLQHLAKRESTMSRPTPQSRLTPFPA